MGGGEKTRKKKEDRDDSRKWNVWMKKKGKNYKKEGEILCHNIFTTFSQKKTLNGRLLLAITNGKKKKTNLSGWFKLKPVITYHLKFAVKILWT